MKNDQADRCVASGNHDENHHVIQLLQAAVNLICGIYRVIQRAGSIQQHHGENKYA